MKRLKMKELERATGVGRETIRYYIREGLLPEPERPSRNVAWYDETYVERIALIKELQQKRFLPLQVIKAILDSDTPPTRAEADALTALDGKLFATENPNERRAPETLGTVAKRVGLSEPEILELAEVGVIAIESRGRTRRLDSTAVRIVELWARIREAGFSDELGFGPRSLRLYVDFVELLAREELRVFARGISGKVDGERAVHMGEVGIDYVAQIIGLMRRAEILRNISQLDLPAAATAAVE